MRRGELRHYVRPSTPDQHRTVVITSSDGINESTRPWLLGIELRERDPGDILAVHIPGAGWAYSGELTKLYRAWIRERVGAMEPDIQSRLDGALRAALDL